MASVIGLIQQTQTAYGANNKLLPRGVIAGSIATDQAAQAWITVAGDPL